MSLETIHLAASAPGSIPLVYTKFGETTRSPKAAWLSSHIFEKRL
jgi:hypothetical protein